MRNSYVKKLVSISLIFVVILTLASCQGRTSSSGHGSGSDSAGSYEASEPPETIIPDSHLRAQEKFTLNDDTVGWLQVPGTTVDDVVLWYPHDNDFYHRRDFDHNYSKTGVYYADFRSSFQGGRDGLSQNTVIYGHSMEDEPDGPIFSQLKKFLDEDFAKKHPYISFSTTDEDMVWEVFAVFHCYVADDRTNNFMYYNSPVFESAQAYSDVISEAMKRSYYTYDTQVTADDKILTLSTCCYNITPAYPNNYRYAVMAKLVDADSVLKEKASFQVNPSPKEP